MKRPCRPRSMAVEHREIPGPATIALAEHRTAPLLHNFSLMDYSLQALLVSCYLQGCEDTAEVMLERGLPRMEEKGDYAI